MNNFWQRRGYLRANNAILAGDATALESALKVGMAAFGEIVPAGDYLYGAASALYSTLSQAENAGLAFKDANGDRMDVDLAWMRFEGAINRQDVDAIPVMVAAAMAAYRALLAHPGLRITQPATLAAEESPPLKIEITGMPPRENLTEIERNAAGDIIRTTQKQADLV